MSIHHTIVKAAAAKGITLVLEDDGITASCNGNTLAFAECDDQEEATVVNEAAKDAWATAQDVLDYMEDHVDVVVSYADGDYIAYEAGASPVDGRRTAGDEIARDPDFADLQESIQQWRDEADEEADVEAEEGDGDEDEGGSVVPQKYKEEYKARGNPNHCGDWLAETLADLIRVKNEKGREVTDIDRLETLATVNGVDAPRFGKLGVETNGWQGRYRMTVRNLMTPLVAAKGFLFVPEGCGRDEDTEVQAPKAWCEAHTSKAKLKEAAKGDEPKPEGGVQKTPGQGKKALKKAAEEAGLKAASEALKSARAKGNR